MQGLLTGVDARGQQERLDAEDAAGGFADVVIPAIAEAVLDRIDLTAMVSEHVYLAAGWSITGRTVGKQMMGLRAVRTNGARIGVGRALIRAILCTFFPVGLVWCAVDRKRRAVHDLLVGTVVQYDWRRRLPLTRRRGGRALIVFVTATS